MAGPEACLCLLSWTDARDKDPSAQVLSTGLASLGKRRKRETAANTEKCPVAVTGAGASYGLPTHS